MAVFHLFAASQLFVTNFKPQQPVLKKQLLSLSVFLLPEDSN